MMMKKEMCLLVTGGAGFIGSNFVLMAIANACTVINVDALTYAGNLESLLSVESDPQHHFVHADIADKEKIIQLLNQYKPDAVVNFSAESKGRATLCDI